MLFDNYGGVAIPAISQGIGAGIQGAAESHLRTRYEPGLYRDAHLINEMIQFHFSFYEKRLEQLLPRIASHGFLEFVLHVYDSSCSVEEKVGALSKGELRAWKERGPSLRRSLKYLAELVCLSCAKAAPKAPKRVAFRGAEQALHCAEMMIRVSMASERAYSLFPSHSLATIYPAGRQKFFRVEVESPHSDYDEKFVARMERDNKGREAVLNGPSFDCNPSASAAILDPAFSKSFGLSFHEFMGILNSAIDGCEPNRAGFPIPFALICVLIDQLAAQGVPEQTSRRIFAGFSISPERLRSDGRVIWKPQQQSRAYRRAFFELPHSSGPHFCFSKGMARESFLYLLQGMSFQKLPSEWRTPETNAALDILSNEAGIWFENKVKAQMLRFGVNGGRAKKSVGHGPKSIGVPATCGEIDFLGYSEQDALLVVAEFKMVNAALEPKFFRDDVSAFASEKNSYASKFRNKVDWVLKNHHSVEAALNLPVGVTRGLATAMITLYPTIASIFIDDFPCVTVTEFVSAYTSAGVWPFQQGLHRW